MRAPGAIFKSSNGYELLNQKELTLDSFCDSGDPGRYLKHRFTALVVDMSLSTFKFEEL